MKTRRALKKEIEFLNGKLMDSIILGATLAEVVSGLTDIDATTVIRLAAGRPLDEEAPDEE